jgi:hypothetical protein
MPTLCTKVKLNAKHFIFAIRAEPRNLFNIRQWGQAVPTAFHTEVSTAASRTPCLPAVSPTGQPASPGSCRTCGPRHARGTAALQLRQFAIRTLLTEPISYNFTAEFWNCHFIEKFEKAHWGLPKALWLGATPWARLCRRPCQRRNQFAHHPSPPPHRSTVLPA